MERTERKEQGLLGHQGGERPELGVEVFSRHLHKEMRNGNQVSVTVLSPTKPPIQL